MPKRISQNELDAVLQAVAGFSEGAGIEEIRTALDGRVPRRTLQRRLALLVEQKRLTVKGRARASRYRLPVIIGNVNGVLPSLQGDMHGEVYVPLYRPFLVNVHLFVKTKRVRTASEKGSLNSRVSVS